MKRIAWLFLFACLPAVAQQPTPEQQIASLQAELQVTRGQREEANNKTAAVIAQANAAIEKMQKRIEELTPKPTEKDAKK